MLKIGTSGYDYLDWKEVFYPAEIDRDAFFEYYTSHFSTVELNFSYYRMPTSKQLKSLVQRSGPGFDFSIKAHNSLTHNVNRHEWKISVKNYMESVSVLAGADKLSAVLLQFPYSFHYTPENRRYLDELTREMNSMPLVVEFRNAEWINKRVFDALRNRNTGFCCVDTPRLKGLPQPLDIVTSKTGYVRFHGRNEKCWWGSDAAARFDYKYSEDELRPWIDRIAEMLKSVEQMRIFFNNHRRGQAVADAMALRKLVEKELTREK
ncbi:MAG: DUF72 domain-containing protein [Spirochaetes bacterium]|nr:DUF72 domain-containing protein [Spirochaetota bacterium]